MTYGFVYFAINPSMPGITKVGMTTKHPGARIAELAGATACPEPFELIAFFDAENPGKVEAEIHKDMETFRVNERREFFDAPLAELVHQINVHVDRSRLMGICCTAILDYLLAEENASFMAARDQREIHTGMGCH